MEIANDSELNKNQRVDKNEWYVLIYSHDKNLRCGNEEDSISLDSIVSIADVFRPKNIGYQINKIAVPSLVYWEWYLIGASVLSRVLFEKYWSS